MHVQTMACPMTSSIENLTKCNVFQLEVLWQLSLLHKNVSKDFLQLDKLGHGPMPGDIVGQAQALIKKSATLEKISQGLQRCGLYQPRVHELPVAAVIEEDETRVTNLHRDRAVTNLRFLNIFYGFSPATFALAVNILDRLLGKVKANPKYLSCIATACFYMAVKVSEPPAHLMTRVELLKLSQCGGHEIDLERMEGLILEKLNWCLENVTCYGFVIAFLDAVLLAIDGGWDCLYTKFIDELMATIEIVSCQFDFTRFKMETLGLAVVAYQLDQYNGLRFPKVFATLLELQYFCQIQEDEFASCLALLGNYMALYMSQPSKPPRLQLAWTVSRRTLSKMKPSTKVLSDLEPIMEDEFMDGECADSPDISCFDSENDEADSPTPRLFLPAGFGFKPIQKAEVIVDPDAGGGLSAYIKRLEILSESLARLSVGK